MQFQRPTRKEPSCGRSPGGSFLFIDLRSINVPNTLEEKIPVSAVDKQFEPLAGWNSKSRRRKSIFALSVFALGLNAAAAAYTMSPAEFAFPNVTEWAANLIPHDKGHPPVPEVLLAALKDIQSTQQQHAAALQEHSTLLQHNAALLQQQSATFDVLRHGLTDEKSDVKKISSQLSTLVAKVELAPKCNNIGDHLRDSKRSSPYSTHRNGAQEDSAAA